MYPISSWIFPASLSIEWPITHASPAVGSRIPVRRRITVVFPAPSGPTRPKISPSPTVKVRRSTATVSWNFRVSPSVRIASNTHLPPLLRPDDRIRRHAGLEFPLRVGNNDLDPVDELHPLFLRLDALRRELGLGGDEGDAPGVLLPRIGVGVDRNGVPYLDPSQVGLLDVRPEPDIGQIAHRNHRGPRGDVVPGLDIFGQNDAGERRGDRPAAAAHLRALKGLPRLLQPGPGQLDRFFSRSLP